MHSRLYPTLLRPGLFRLPPEQAHDLVMTMLARASRHRALLRLLPAPPAALAGPVTVAGLPFPNRIGLAAGFDKNGVALPAWERLGFGFAEIGTITAKAQPGNPRPRIFRYPKNQALINRLGFNNLGADQVAAILARHRQQGWPRIVVGINLGKSKTTPLEEAVDDYLYSLERLHRFADYLVLNVSSPNTPNLRSLQHGEALRALLSAVQNHALQQSSPRPVFLKIAPDLNETALSEILETASAAKISGLIATNTTLDHNAVAGAGDETGGLSGAPLKEKAEAVLNFLRQHSDLPLIGVGGIMNGDDVRERFAAGADLLQIYTGFVYGGPPLLSELLLSERQHRPHPTVS